MTTKSELVKAVSAKMNCSMVNAEVAVHAVLDAMQESLKQDGKLTLVGFGTFAVKDKPAREARNPKTGEKVKVPAKKGVKFSAGKGLLESV